MSRGWCLCQNFCSFDIRGVLYVYINREIQGMPVLYKSSWNVLFSDFKCWWLVISKSVELYNTLFNCHLKAHWGVYWKYIYFKNIEQNLIKLSIVRYGHWNDINNGSSNWRQPRSGGFVTSLKRGKIYHKIKVSVHWL